MGVTVCHRITQDSIIFSDKHKVDTPGVNTDGGQLKTTACHFLQTFDHLKIKGIDVPVEMSARLNEVIGETGQFLLFQFSTGKRAQNSPATGRPKVDGKEIVFSIHIFSAKIM